MLHLQHPLPHLLIYSHLYYYKNFHCSSSRPQLYAFAHDTLCLNRVPPFFVWQTLAHASRASSKVTYSVKPSLVSRGIYSFLPLHSPFAFCPHFVNNIALIWLNEVIRVGPNPIVLWPDKKWKKEREISPSPQPHEDTAEKGCKPGRESHQDLTMWAL